MRIVTADVIMDENELPVLVKEKATNYPSLKGLGSMFDVVKVMTDVFAIDKQISEMAYIVALNTKLKPINFFSVNKVTVNSSLVDVRGIMIRLLLSNAATFIMVHNHVSGETEPSKEDENITRRISEAASVMGIVLCDHIIIGRDKKFYSFREMQRELFQ